MTRPTPGPITIDITRLIGRALRGRSPTGIDRVGLEYVRHYRDAAHALVRIGPVWLEPGRRASRRLFEDLLHGRLRRTLAVRAMDIATDALWQLCLSEAGARPVLNPLHSGTERPSYGSRLLLRGRRMVYVLHDLIPLMHPQYSRPGEDARHRQRLATLLDIATAVVANSQDTATRFLGYAQAAGSTPPPVTVAPLGVTRLPPPGPAPLDRPYFVVVGTIEPRKNHALLLQVWRRLAVELGDATPVLVVIGRRGWECEHVVDFLERCPETRRHVREVSYADDAQLAGWLARACALLFPTFAEGYGLPVTEALSVGLPVIASDLPVFRESVGDIPDYLDPLDGPAWHQAVLDYLAPDHARRVRQLQRMGRFVAPTWEVHFSIVDGIIGPLTQSAGAPADPSTGTLEAAVSRS